MTRLKVWENAYRKVVRLFASISTHLLLRRPAHAPVKGFGASSESRYASRLTPTSSRMRTSRSRRCLRMATMSHPVP